MRTLIIVSVLSIGMSLYTIHHWRKVATKATFFPNLNEWSCRYIDYNMPSRLPHLIKGEGCYDSCIEYRKHLEGFYDVDLVNACAVVIDGAEW